MHKVDVPNRDLLMEFCQGLGLAVLNSYVDADVREKVTFREAGASAFGPISEDKYHVLDLILCEHGVRASVQHLRSIPEAVLATDHFLVKFQIQFSGPQEEEPAKKRGNRTAKSKVKDVNGQAIIEQFYDGIAGADVNQSTLEENWDRTKKAMETAKDALKSESRPPNKPWISTATMDLIDQRQAARVRNHNAEESRLHKEIQSSAKRPDRLDREYDFGRKLEESL